MTRTIRCPFCKGQKCFYTQMAFGVEIKSCRPCCGKGRIVIWFATKVASAAAHG